jgi:hypothetical protein
MAAEPRPSFRWGVLKRLSQYNTKRMAGAEGLEHFEEATTRQELDVVRYIKATDMGVVVATYSDIASGWDESAKRPGFEAALDDLKAGRIDGIAVWKLDRLVRRVSQFRRVLDVLEASGGRLLSVTEGIDTADPERKFVTASSWIYSPDWPKWRATTTPFGRWHGTPTEPNRASFRRAAIVPLGTLRIGSAWSMRK